MMLEEWVEQMETLLLDFQNVSSKFAAVSEKTGEPVKPDQQKKAYLNDPHLSFNSNAKYVLRGLRHVEHTAAKQVCTFEVRVTDMAKDAADVIEEALHFIDIFTVLPSCNDCKKQDKEYCPKIGEPVRYNSPCHSNYQYI